MDNKEIIKMDNSYELSDEEKEYLSDYNRYNNKITMSEIYDFLNKLLLDRYNRGKEEIRKDIMKMADDETKGDTETLYDIIHYVNI